MLSAYSSLFGAEYGCHRGCHDLDDNDVCICALAVALQWGSCVGSGGMGKVGLSRVGGRGGKRGKRGAEAKFRR